jgi:hypothetical protein
MGTDYLQLMDRRTAEVIIEATAADLAAIVDLKTAGAGPLVWRNYWDAQNEAFVDFVNVATAAARLATILRCGSSLNEIKQDLIRELCIGRALLHLDYWGCWAEVFSVQDPPGALTWENFTAPIRGATERPTGESTESSGCYVLTNHNVASILSSLEAHRSEMEIMNDAQIERLRAWLALCSKHQEFSILYQIDF